MRRAIRAEFCVVLTKWAAGEEQPPPAPPAGADGETALGVEGLGSRSKAASLRSRAVSPCPSLSASSASRIISSASVWGFFISRSPVCGEAVWRGARKRQRAT